jgi:hypothetical protein
MSDDTPQTPEDEGALDLSGLNFGPAWARDPSESKSLKKFKDRGDRDDRRGGGGRRDDRGGGGGPRRDHRGGGGFKGNRGGGHGRRDDDRRPPRQEVEPPAGVTMQIMPAEESLDLLAKRVVDSGQTFSVFDLAKVLLQSRDRFRVTFDSPEKAFFRCREDQSIWLTRDEAMRHLWRSDWVGKYYEEVKVEGDAPKGSFSSVARCGISNEILGPPNYHGYQEKLGALHRERFSNMNLNQYKSKVRVEHGEEAVEAWLESMKTVTKWRVAPPEEAPPEEAPSKNEEPNTGEEKPAVDEEAASPEAAVVEETPAVEAETVSPEEATEESPVPESDVEEPAEESQAEAAGEETPTDETGAGESPAEEVVPEEPVLESAELFDDARAVERHFAENHFEEAFEETNRAWVIGDIRGNLLSPGLLTLLKYGVAEEKRYPSKLMPLVCRQLSGRHVAVFKWHKKLKVGPSRPHAVPEDTQLAERPRAMTTHLAKKSGIPLKEFWEALMPGDVTAEQKHEWLQDFQWLLSQGHIILLSDTTVHLAKQSDNQPPQKKTAARKVAGKEKNAPAKEEPKAEESIEPAKDAPKLEEEKLVGEETSKPEESEVKAREVEEEATPEATESKNEEESAGEEK